VILFVSGEYPPDVGGVGDYTQRLRAALGRQGWRTEVLSRGYVRRWDARSLVALARAAPRRGLVHIQYQAGAYDLLGDVCLMPALLRRLRPGVRTVTTFHDVRVPYLFPRAGGLRQKAVRFLSRTSHAVVAADRRDLEALDGPSPRHHHIPIGSNVACAPPRGYDRDAFRAQLGLASQDLVVVYFGLLNVSKGLDLLVDAFQAIRGHCPTARLLMLGGQTGASDPTDHVTAARIHGRLSPFGASIIRAGWLPPTELSAYLLSGDVALLPYADGASGRRGSLLACAEHALPIVSTLPAAEEVSACIEAVQPTPVALAEAVLRIHAEPLRQRAASRALAERMSWPRIAAEHVTLYEHLLQAGR
jgi:glycosyltransferase involved in cell wall biosynthesis